jgi:CRP/FNR family transcriptional regulator, anaerobic regulatory protein
MSDPNPQAKDPIAFLSQRISRSASPCDQCAVREHSFCDVLQGQEFSRLAAIVTGRSFGARQTVVQEGDRAEWLFNIISGTVKLYRTLTDGRTQIVGFLRDGDFVGEPAGPDYLLSAEAITPVQVCVFPKRAFDRLTGECQALEKKLFELARREVAAAHEHMLLLGRKTASERVASFLVESAVTGAGSPEPYVHLPMARNEIADYLGLTMETVSRTLTKFRAQGLIVLRASDHVLLSRFDRLREIAGVR